MADIIEYKAERKERYAYDDAQADQERSARRRQRMLEMKRKKQQQERMRKLFAPCALALAVCVVFAVIGVRSLVGHHSDKAGSAMPAAENEMETAGREETQQTAETKQEFTYNAKMNMTGFYTAQAMADTVHAKIGGLGVSSLRTVGGHSSLPPLDAKADGATTSFAEEVVSGNGVFIDVARERIVAQKDAGMRISPASMTKILTVLVAAEHVTDLDDTFEITIDITDYSFVNDCSNVGFEVGECVTVRDLFYGTILPSGADAALGLAIYAAGTQETFVEWMNEKARELGLSKTSHFTNCVGLYDEDHYSTVYDMAVILKAACDNSFCREVLSAHTYTTSPTAQHAEGITISNWFLRRIEDKETEGEVLCAKTGFVVQSGNCAASMGISLEGEEYICVTAHATSSWRCIYDHVALYQQFFNKK